MNTIRHLALQLELSRIESDAVAHSAAIIDRAADLEAAYDLCLTVSVGLSEHDAFRPTVSYEDDEAGTTCQINIFALERGAEFLESAIEAGLTFVHAGRDYGVLRDLEFTGYPRVHVLVHESALTEIARPARKAA